MVVPVISSGKVSYISSLVMASYTDNDNASIGVTFNAANSAFSVIITLSSGNATYAKNEITLLTEAPSNGNAYGRKNGDWVKVPEKSDVLTKGNETEYTPTQDYHPATKKYVDESKAIKYINISDSTILEISNSDTSSAKLRELIGSIFGSKDTFINIVDNIVDNDTEYQFVSTNGSSPNRFRLGSIGTWRNVDKTSYELAFTLTFIDSSRCYCKAYFISLQNTSSFDGYFIIRDIITSDNLTTITKKTAAEYEALGSKDANTAYCVTD